MDAVPKLWQNMEVRRKAQLSGELQLAGKRVSAGDWSWEP